jgi:3-deoxy-D-manno-octulosonic-acid transferase
MSALAAYRVATVLAGPVLQVVLRRRLARGKEDPARWTERRGEASAPRPDGPLVWLHAASVGESLSLLPLLAALRRQAPRVALLVTTGTVTSARLLADRLPDGVIHQFSPIDRAAWVRRFLDHWRPDLALTVESELWPNLLGMAQARGIPTGLLNARMSERSYRTWRRLPVLVRPLLAGLQLCLAQNATQAQRLAALGARDPQPVGNLKFAAAPLEADPDALAQLQAATRGRTLWLAASTHADEEVAAAQAHETLAGQHPGLLTVIAPRHPERADAIRQVLADRGLRVAQRSRAEAPDADTSVYLVDTLGELGLFYRLAGVAFVGGSLAGVGGHNPIEPARLGCAVLHGPDMRNFAEVAEDLAEAGGSWQVADAAHLARALDRLLGDAAVRRHQADAAADVAQRQAGVLQTVLDALAPYLADLRARTAG